MSVAKIKIIDNSEIRSQIDKLYETQNQIILAKWSLSIANRIIEITNLQKEDYPEIDDGFNTNLKWQNRQARIHDVRQSGFKIHKIAREQTDEISNNVFRTIGQAIGSGHMKEHSMVTSDYAIKVINLVFPNDITKVTEERTWQLNELIKFIDK